MAAKAKKRKKPKFILLKTYLGDVRHSDLSLSFFAYVMILLVVGLVMMASASYAWAYSKTGDGLYYAKKQAVFAVVGFVAMLFFMKMDYHNFKKITLPFVRKFSVASILYAAVALLLVAVLIWGNTEEGAMGAKRWIDIGPINLQPSEVAKFSLIVFFAYSMEKDAKKMDTFHTGIVKYAFFLAIYVGLIAAEHHISGIMLIGTIALSLMLCGGAKRSHLAVFVTVAGILAAAYIYIKAKDPGSYVNTRITTWLHPFSDPLGDTYQTDNSIIAIGSGGLFGLGLGNSRQKYFYLPESQNDFVFPIACEELGFVGALAIIIVFLLLVIEGYSIAVRCKDRFGMLLAVGITTQIGIQTVLNMAVVSNLIPNTGISLPFFSYGGTALVMQLVEMGIMLNISQQRYYKPNKNTVNADRHPEPEPEPPTPYDEPKHA